MRRFRAGGADALFDRSSPPHSSPQRTTHSREVAVLAARERLRQGPLRLAVETGVPARTISRILTRHGVPRLSWCDPLTGRLIRASRTTAHRYERERPGQLVHVDLKKLGRIPDGGGWRVHGRSEEVRDRGIGYDFVHAAVDDHSRLAYAEIYPDERSGTCAGFLRRAADYLAAHGITRVEQVITDNALAYRRAHAFPAAVTELGAQQLFIKPHCPWQNGIVERFNRTLADKWTYRRPFDSNTARADALAPFIEHDNTERVHSAHRATPAARVSPR